MSYVHERLIEHRNKFRVIEGHRFTKSVQYTCLVRAMFISTCLCELPFSLVKQKNSEVSRLKYAHTYGTKSKVAQTQVLQLILIR